MSDSFNEITGRRIQDIRVRKGFSREALSERAGISSGFLGSIEKGEKGISAQTLYGISRALNITSDFILFGIVDSAERCDYASQVLASLNSDEVEAVRTILETAIASVRSMGKHGKKTL